MADCMSFPRNFETFLEDYSFKDNKEYYTNGADLIPIFRVQQGLEHFYPKAYWTFHKGQQICSNCGGVVCKDTENSITVCQYDYCPFCGAEMNGEMD